MNKLISTLTLLLSLTSSRICPLSLANARTQSFEYGNLCTTDRHVHLSTGKDASSSVTVSFSSHLCDLEMNNAKQHDHVSIDGASLRRIIPASVGAVLIGTNPDRLNLVKGSQPNRYNATISVRSHQNVGQKLDYLSEYQHHITVSNLEPDTRYYYKCVVMSAMTETSSGEEDDSIDFEDEQRKLRGLGQSQREEKPSSMFQFTTGPSPGKHARAKVAIIGDVGAYKHSKETLAVLARKQNEFNSIILVGDISYANGDHRKWDGWFDMMDVYKLLRQKPLYIVAGNHDAEGDLDSGSVFAAYENRFQMPQVAPANIGKVTKSQDIDLNRMYQLPYDYGNSFYSFTLGPSYNIVLNSFADFEPGSVQHGWLVKELRQTDRELTPWVVVFSHCPIYNTFTKHRYDIQLVMMKKILEPLFVESKVNFFVSGHLHAYMRTLNVIHNKPNAAGPMHIIVGNGGRQANAPFNSDIAEDWVAVRDHTTYGFSTIEYLNATTARYEWVQTGHNTLDDKGDNFLNVKENLNDSAYVNNQYYL